MAHAYSLRNSHRTQQTQRSVCMINLMVDNVDLNSKPTPHLPQSSDRLRYVKYGCKTERALLCIRHSGFCCRGLYRINR